VTNIGITNGNCVISILTGPFKYGKLMYPIQERSRIYPEAPFTGKCLIIYLEIRIESGYDEY
jgi:hypothetical protein